MVYTTSHKAHIAVQKEISRRRSRHFMWAFVFLSVVCLGAVSFWPQIMSFLSATEGVDEDFLVISEKEAVVAQAQSFSRIKPSDVHGARFFHSGPDKTLLTIKSEKVSRPLDGGTVHLDSVSGSSQFSDGSAVFMTADKGEVVPDEDGYFILEGNVNIMQEQGHDLITDTVQVDFPKQTIISPHDVEISSPLGKLKGEGSVIDYKNRTLEIFGKSTITLNDERKQVAR